jgi:hypothetical protein
LVILEAQTATMAVLVAEDQPVAPSVPPDREPLPEPPTTLDVDVIRMRWMGGATPEPLAEQPLTGRSHHALGGDPESSGAGIPLYGQVRYPEIYPGIDLVFRPEGAALHYDIELAPGANPTQIRLRFEGTTQLAVEAEGDLRLTTARGHLLHRAPRVFQEKGGKRQSVEGRFALRADGDVGFELGAHDASATIVIDPEIELSRSLPNSRNHPLQLGPEVALGAGPSAWMASTLCSPF